MMKTVKVNYILNAHNNGKKYFQTVNAKKVLKLDEIYQRYGEIRYKNSQKPAKRQFGRHCFFS